MNSAARVTGLTIAGRVQMFLAVVTVMSFGLLHPDLDELTRALDTIAARHAHDTDAARHANESVDTALPMRPAQAGNACGPTAKCVPILLTSEFVPQIVHLADSRTQEMRAHPADLWRHLPSPPIPIVRTRLG